MLATLPENEQERIGVVHEYHILDTLPEPEFDDITQAAAELCHVPVAIIAIIDSKRAWFKSKVGTDIQEAAREDSFCDYLLNEGGHDVLIVQDATRDARFFNKPMVHGAPYYTFYAGVPLINPEGYVIGSLCIMDYVCRQLSRDQVSMLRSLGRQAELLLELNRKSEILKDKQAELVNVYGDLQKFARMASHDLKSPINNIISLTRLLQDEYGAKFDTEANEYLEYLDTAANQMSDFITGILAYSKASQLSLKEKQKVFVEDMVAETIDALKLPGHVKVSTDSQTGRHIIAPQSALQLILKHLVENAVLHNDKAEPQVDVRFNEDKYSYSFRVKDNGPGIPADWREKVFDLFKKANPDKSQEGHYGIGLTVVKMLVNKMGGTLKMLSDADHGTTVSFTIPR